MPDTAKQLILQDSHIVVVIDDWFDSLQKSNTQEKGPPFNGRAERAALRRAPAPYGALLCAGYYRLATEITPFLPPNLASAEWQPALALFARVASSAKRHRPEKHFAAQLGEKSPGGKRCLSELRFNRLLRVTSPEELCRQLIRAVNIRGEKGVDLLSLADGIFLWMQEWSAGQQQRPVDLCPLRRHAVRWASEYFQASQTSGSDHHYDDVYSATSVNRLCSG